MTNLSLQALKVVFVVSVSERHFQSFFGSKEIRSCSTKKRAFASDYSRKRNKGLFIVCVCYILTHSMPRGFRRKQRQGSMNLLLLTKYIQAMVEQRGRCWGGFTSDIWQKIKNMTAKPGRTQSKSTASKPSSVSIILLGLLCVVTSAWFQLLCNQWLGSERSRQKAGQMNNSEGLALWRCQIELA